MPLLSVITGTRREAFCFRSLIRTGQIEITCSGANSNRATVLAEQAVAAGATSLLSFGLAGGLDPSLGSGTLVVAESIIDPPADRFSTDEAWRLAVAEDLTKAGIDFVSGAGIGADEAIPNPEAKKKLFEDTQALFVDMESHAVMQVAREHGVPCLVIRAIADSALDILPNVAMTIIDSDGEVRYGALAQKLLSQPSDIFKLISLWRVSRHAFANLSRVASLPSLRGSF